MKVEMSREKILPLIQIAEKVAGKNMTLPVLSGISISAEGSKVSVRATNLDIGVDMEFSAKVIEPGTAVVPASVLLGFLSSADEEKVTFVVEGGALTVDSGHAKATINTLPSDDFPIIPASTGDTVFTIPAALLSSGIRSVIFSASSSTVKPELASVNMFGDGQELVFVATDSFRLAEKRITLRDANDIPQTLIPARNALEVSRFLDTVKGNVEVKLDGKQLSVSQDSLVMVSRLIDGSFPDYRQIIPKEGKTSVTVLKNDLVSALRLANVFSDTFHQAVFDIDPSKKLFTITTKSSIGENSVAIPAALEGDPITISFNYRYITEAFSSFSADSLSIALVGPGRPALIQGVGEAGFRYIVMPMNR